MSVFQPGQRVFITHGLNRGKSGSIQGTEEDEFHVLLVRVILDGENESRLFRTSVLMKEYHESR